MKKGITRFIPILLFAGILLPWLSAQNILTQSAEEPAAQVDSTVAPILPFGLSEISLESNNTITRANKMGANQVSDEELTTFKSEVDSFLIPIDTFLLDTSYRNLDKFTNWDLEKISNRANLYLGQVDLRESQLRKQYNVLEESYTSLDDLKKRWQITREKGVSDEIQETLLGRIDLALETIDSVNTLLQADMESMLLLTDQLLDRQTSLNTLQDNAQDARLALSQNMFKRDNRPLFRDFSQFKDTALVSNHFKKAGNSIRGDAKVFRAEFPQVIRTTIILFIILISLLTWFSYNYKKVISLNKINLKEVQRNLIRSPLLISIFSTFVIIFFSFPELPFTFGVINLLILSVPIAILAIRFIGKGVEYWVIWAIVSYMLTLIYRLSFAPDVIQRIFLLFLSLTGIVMYTWMMMNKESHHLFKSEAGHKAERSLAIIFLGMMVVAVFANIAGLFGLAAFLTLIPFQLSFLLVVVKVLINFSNFIFYILLGSKVLLRVNAIADYNFVIYRWISRLVNIFFFIFFLMNTLRILRVKQVFLDWGSEILTSEKKLGEASFSLESILIFVFVIWLSVFLTKIIRYVLEKDVFVRVSTSKGLPGTIIMMVRIFLITAGFFLAAAAAGMELTKLSIIIGAFSVGIGFGLQNIFNNMVSGMILAFERPINVGDVVQVGTLMGTVTNLGLRASKVKSFDGAEVIVPNGNLISDQLINWTLSDAHRRMDIRVGVAYGTDPKVVLSIILEVANGHPKVRKHPAPSAYFVGFGDSSLDFRLLAWVELDSRLSVESELHISINDRIIEAGIEIPFPQRDLHIRSDDTKVIPEVHARDQPGAKVKAKQKSNPEVKPQDNHTMDSEEQPDPDDMDS